MLRRHFLASGAVALLAVGVEGSAAQAGASRKVAIASTRIVGRRGSRAADRTAIAEGSPVVLRRVPGDRFDPRAIVALDEQGRALGRLPGVDCRILARLLDAGVPLEGRIARAVPGGTLGLDILMSVSGTA